MLTYKDLLSKENRLWKRRVIRSVPTMKWLLVSDTIELCPAKTCLNTYVVVMLKVRRLDRRPSGFAALRMCGTVRPCSIDFTDGGATDVPILGPMELKDCISVLYCQKSLSYSVLYSYSQAEKKGSQLTVPHTLNPSSLMSSQHMSDRLSDLS